MSAEVDRVNAQVAEVERLRAQVAELRSALRRACSLATTHRAEDRQEILELARLAEGHSVAIVQRAKRRK